MSLHDEYDEEMAFEGQPVIVLVPTKFSYCEKIGRAHV